MREIKLLDCTLRDGGNALEDEYYYNKKVHSFENSKGKVLEELASSQIDIIEMGIIEKHSKERRDFSYYGSIEEASLMIPKKRSNDQLFVVGSNIKNDNLGVIPNWNSGLCDGVRTYLVYSELEESLKYSQKIAEKGYRVFLQNALTIRYTEQDLDKVIGYSNEMNAYAVYIVDTNGYMTPEDVIRLADYLDKRLNKEIRIGFHAHNNISLALTNTLSFLNLGIERDVIIDSCLWGMGRGAGNLQTELAVPILNQCFTKEYRYDHVLNACEYIESFVNDNIWGYSLVNALAAVHKTSNKYTIDMRSNHSMTYSEINQILSRMPVDMKHRYTKDNIEKLIGNNI